MGRYLASSPAATVLLTATLAAADRLLAAIAVDDSLVGWPERLLEVVLVLTIAAAALRVVLIALIQERNAVLARNIRDAAFATAARPGAGQSVVGDSACWGWRM